MTALVRKVLLPFIYMITWMISLLNSFI